MPDTPLKLAERLREEGGRAVQFFKHLSSDQWGVFIYPEESEWSFHQLLAHFVSAEIGRKELITNICAGGKGAPDGFEIDKFNQSEVERLSVQSNNDLLRQFSQERANLITLISAMSSRDLERVGNDPYLGEVPLLEMIKLTYRHLQIHLREARQRI
jgi:hypothetical protein